MAINLTAINRRERGSWQWVINYEFTIKNGKTNAKQSQNTAHAPDRSVCPRRDCVTTRPVQRVNTCVERGFRTVVGLWFCPFPKRLIQVQTVLELWEIQPVLPIQPTHLEKTVTHPFPSKCTASTGATQAGRGGDGLSCYRSFGKKTCRFQRFPPVEAWSQPHAPMTLLAHRGS